MPSFTVKNIPDDVYDSVRRSAAANRRSINSEIIVVLERAFRHAPAEIEAILEEARQLRERTAHYRLTNEELQAMKRRGRS
jgi:hypothetical protein